MNNKNHKTYYYTNNIIENKITIFIYVYNDSFKIGKKKLLE